MNNPLHTMSGGKKAVLLLSTFAVLFLGVQYAANHGWLPSKIGKVIAPSKYDLPPVEDAKLPDVKPLPYPTNSPASVSAPQIISENWEWSAQDSSLLANGGSQTMKGSLMEKHGVNLLIKRQDDTNKMVTDLIACAKQIHDGDSSCTTGANIIDIMGDQTAEVAAQANPQLLKFGPDYGLKLIGATGYSRGEDACMLPSNLKDDPKSIATTKMLFADGTELPTHGVVFAASPHEGDWDICMKWAGDNAIPNNPDPTTFDADALNIMEEPDYNTAAADYVSGNKCEDRREVSKGRLTGKKVRVCVNGVATWTPGDVTVATKRGGLVKVADSLMYRSMMPSVIVGSGHFINQNKTEFENMLRATWDAADQIKAYDAALHRASEIATKVYGDDGGDPRFHGGDYWYHYFHPVQQKDMTGAMVSLGGSAVSNMADNLILFGFNGNNNNMMATYNIFRSVNLQQYPTQYRADGPTPLPEAKAVIDRSLIKDIDDAVENGEGSAGAQADTEDFSHAGSSQQVSQKVWKIEFDNNSAELQPGADSTLRDLLDSIAITGLKVQIDGYTDNTGTDAVNIPLSQGRADKVKSWLQQHARRNFPNSRFVSVEGHGSADPVASNATPDGREKNRRVVITLLN